MNTPSRSFPFAEERTPTRAIPGKNSTALRDREAAFLAPGLQGFALGSGIAVSHASRTSVFDVDGNEYLDLIGGNPLACAAAAMTIQEPAIRKNMGILEEVFQLANETIQG